MQNASWPARFIQADRLSKLLIKADMVIEIAGGVPTPSARS